MDRLTQKDTVAGMEYFDLKRDIPQIRAIDMLGQYEDTGLTPEQIERLKAEIQEYKDKLADGRMDELPCKIGDEVYIINEKYPCKIEKIIIEDNDFYFEWASFERSYEIAECWDEGSFEITDIGKTVFLTREEAEQALKEMEANNG